MRHKCCQHLNPQEARLADTPTQSSSRPLIVTIGALVVTALVIAGLALWPSTSTCMNGGGAFGSCVQQSLAERGILPTPEMDAPVTAEPELDDAPVETAEPDEDMVDAAPAIDARVEADGSSILAGTVEPNVDVHLFFNGIEVGQTTSDSVGDWIFIPDEPLPMGGIAITLGTGVEGEEIAEVPQALAVVVDGESQPTVTAAAPDELAALIEELTGTPPEMAADEPMEIAAIEPDDVPEVDEPETSVPDAELIAPEPEAVSETPAAVEESEPVEAPVEEPTVADEPEVEAERPTVEEPTPDPVTSEEEPMQMAAVEPDQVVPDEPVTAVPPAIAVAPTIDAVEIDPDRSYIAGAGQDGALMRLYVEDQLVGESPIEGNRWLVETDETLTEPSQRIRAEMVGDDGMVLAEAEINFVIEQPETASEILILPDDQLAPIALPTEAPSVVADLPQPTELEMEADSQDLILPADSLSVMMLPTEAPIVVADLPEVPALESADDNSNLVLPAESLSGMSLPTEAPSISAESQTAPVLEVAEDEPEAVTILPDDQLPEIALPTEAPLVALPAVQTPDQPEIVIEAPELEVAELPEANLILPDDQLAPIALPTEAPSVDLPTEPLTAPQVAEAEPTEPVADGETGVQPETDVAPEMAVESDTTSAEPSGPTIQATPETETAEAAPVTLPADQLPEIELPTEAPAVVSETPTAGSSEPIEVADAPDPVSVQLPADPLPAIALPTEAPPVDLADAEPAPVPAPAPVRLPADQLPEIALPTEAPTIAVAEADPAPVPAPAPVRLPDDQLPAIALPTEAPPVPAVRPETAMEATAETETDPEVPTLIATPVGNPEDGRFASGKVIIRRGDNLWTISRRVYGRGIQYTRIFDANREKISNPNLIFPGQVFDLPEASEQ